MAAPVTFLAGRAGSGKSRLIRRQVAELCARGENVALIVPEQFTFETERELAAALPGGLLQASVFSFTSLARRVLRETGERTVFLSRQGRRMVVRKTAEEEARRLTAYGGVSARAGFAEQCDAFFTECKRFNITPEQLQGAAERLPAGTPFQARLSDLALLYARTEDYLSGRNMDAADAFAALCERLPRSSIAGQAVIIDGFDLISEQLYDVIAALMRCASSLTISLRVDLSPDCRDHTVFEAERRLLMRLRDIARREGSPTRIVRLPIAGPHEDESKRAHPALRHLEHEGFAYPFLPYTGDDAAEAISLFAGTSRTAEAEAVADAILAAADRGIRYRDMAVIATDLDAYINPVSRALRARGIPCAVVPGVTSAVAGPAAAGIPVTHRGVASGFHVFTAHDRNDALADIDFAALVKAGGTCVFLMGLSLVGEIAARFASAGAAPVTPVAVISRATLPEQREVRGTLADIAARVGEAGLVSPAVIVVGGVVEACP